VSSLVGEFVSPLAGAFHEDFHRLTDKAAVVSQAYLGLDGKQIVVAAAFDFLRKHRPDKAQTLFVPGRGLYLKM
jgi:hypothetical protein